ncbi:MAG: hypothetical protein WCH21_12430 [Bacteroidota bacterium]
MKKITITTLTMLITTLFFGQIDDELTKAKWKIGKDKVIYETTIKRLEGNNDAGGVTNVGYETFDKLIAKTTKKADSEMWTPEKKEKMLDLYQRASQGGMVYLYINRLTIGAANLKYFTVIIKDSTDSKEILRQELDDKIPNVPSGNDYWWNYSSIPIPEKIAGKFYIYIIDKLGGDNNKFKFETRQ